MSLVSRCMIPYGDIDKRDLIIVYVVYTTYNVARTTYYVVRCRAHDLACRAHELFSYEKNVLRLKMSL